MMGLQDRFPPLYECSVCGAAVKVSPVDGAEPVKKFKCGHDGAVIWANRKATLRGKGQLDAGVFQRTSLKIKLTVRQFLSALTGRSI
jgi:hypothetical protein